MARNVDPRDLDLRDIIPDGSQRGWANAAGVSVDTLNSIAMKRRSMSERMRDKLAAAAHVPPAWVDALLEATKRTR